MKREQAKNPKKAKSPPEKSFTVAIEQMAQLLRSQVKLKDRSTKIVKTSALPKSFKNAFEQIAQLLRKEVRTLKEPKKRSWKRKDA